MWCAKGILPSAHGVYRREYPLCARGGPSGLRTSKKARLFWALLLILLPIGLIFSDSSMANMQSVSIIAAFPIALVIVLIIAAFIKDAKMYANEIHLPE